MGHMDRTYKASAESSSRNPHDWGRAMAQALESLARQARSSPDDGSYDDLLGQDLQLHIVESGDGVVLSLTWTPSGPPDDAESQA